MPFSDPFIPSAAELKTWAYNAGVQEPIQDWDILVDWFAYAPLVLSFAADSTCPNKGYFLHILHIMTGKIVRSPMDPAQLFETITKAQEIQDPDVLAWVKASKYLLKHPGTYKYDDWFAKLPVQMQAKTAISFPALEHKLTFWLHQDWGIDTAPTIEQALDVIVSRSRAKDVEAMKNEIEAILDLNIEDHVLAKIMAKAFWNYDPHDDFKSVKDFLRVLLKKMENKDPNKIHVTDILCSVYGVITVVHNETSGRAMQTLYDVFVKYGVQARLSKMNHLHISGAEGQELDFTVESDTSILFSGVLRRGRGFELQVRTLFKKIHEDVQIEYYEEDVCVQKLHISSDN